MWCSGAFGTQETLWPRPEKLPADACGLQEDDRSSAEKDSWVRLIL